MPIFDAHIHVQPWEMIRRDALALLDDEVHRGAAELLQDAKKLLAFLDEQGVQRACLINYVAPEVMGFTSDVNDWIATYTRDHRDRLLPVGSVHPKVTPDTHAEIRRVLHLGIRMIKIHPPHQLFRANAYLDEMPSLAEVYKLCEERGVPVMVHTGTSVFPRARNRFADPMPVDDVAIDFPNLKIILAHAGRPLYGQTAFFLVRRHRNVYVDLSGIPPRALLRYVPRLGDIADRALWGTDWPSPGVASIARNVEEFRALGFPVADQEKILWANASEIFE